MNQILKQNAIDKKENNNKKKSFKNNFNFFYKFQFISSCIIAFILIVILFFKLKTHNKNEKFSKDLISIYNVSTLYSDNNNYTSNLSNLYKNNISTTLDSPFIIGIIKIEKINLNYPILSNINKELLDISVCRFAGPMPNEIGNLCIAGHNYVDYKFFSRLNELEKNDNIKIYDLTGNMIEYNIFKIYESNPNDISCTFQDTNGQKIITLLTCNNISGKRLILVAKQK